MFMAVSKNETVPCQPLTKVLQIVGLDIEEIGYSWLSAWFPAKGMLFGF